MSQSTHILAIDNDPLATKICAENAAANGVADKVTATDSPIESITDQFPLVLANIIAPVLIELSEAIVNAIEPGGTLILSGMLDTQVESVKETYSSLSPQLRWTDNQSEGEWHALIATLPR